MRFLDRVAAVVSLNDVGRVAIVLPGAQAELLAGDQVGAARIDFSVEGC